MELLGPFATTKGLRQGDGLACLLFNLVLESRNGPLSGWPLHSRVETSGTIFYKITQILAYADDKDIIGLRFSYIVEAYQGIQQAAKILGLQIHEANTKLIIATSATLPITKLNLRVCDVQIGQFWDDFKSTFTYVGSMISSDNSMDELRARTLAACDSSSPQRTCRDGRSWDYILPI